MDTYKIATICVSGVSAVPIELNPITRGITGAVVEFIYDDDIWAGLRKKVAFRGTAEKEDICDGNTVTFPAEVAQRKNARITVGVTGVSSDGKIVIPTLWADLGTVRDSAYGDYPAPGEPVPPIWAKVMADVNSLAERVEDLEENPSAGGLNVTDDGEGNVTITASGSAQITEDGNGNVVIS